MAGQAAKRCLSCHCYRNPRVGDEPVRVQRAFAAPAVGGGVPDRHRPVPAHRVGEAEQERGLRDERLTGRSGEGERAEHGVESAAEPGGQHPADLRRRRLTRGACHQACSAARDQAEQHGERFVVGQHERRHPEPGGEPEAAVAVTHRLGRPRHRRHAPARSRCSRPARRIQPQRHHRVPHRRRGRRSPQPGRFRGPRRRAHHDALGQPFAVVSRSRRQPGQLLHAATPRRVLTSDGLGRAGGGKTTSRLAWSGGKRWSCTGSKAAMSTSSAFAATSTISMTPRLLRLIEVDAQGFP